MKNSYRRHKNTVHIDLDRIGKEPIQLIIDADDLHYVDQFEGKWYPSWREDKQAYFAMGYQHDNGSYRPFYFHRYLTDVSPDMLVEFVDGNPLNCRQSNLRIVNRSANQRNRKGPNKNNGSAGILGVTFDKQSGKYAARISVNGKKMHLGLFANPTQAGKIVAKKRKELASVTTE